MGESFTCQKRASDDGKRKVANQPIQRRGTKKSGCCGSKTAIIAVPKTASWTIEMPPTYTETPLRYEVPALGVRET